ncbi:MAG TPA: T9SS type A sorting domain-containing protein, partial [Bacteroidales bacterium]|nr:T9SS type A sorting domain-containing protein [Bacteroidales bacterium]
QLTTFPGSKPVRIRLWGAVPAGTYSVTFTAAGPNGTPVHRRTATLTVVAGSNLQASVTLQPDRQVCAGDTVHVPIRVTGSNIHCMSFYISYDTSVLMQPEPYYCSAHPAMAVSCYPAPVNSNTLSIGLTLAGTSVITLSNSTVVELIFLAKAPSIASVHLRRSPDPAPLSVITDGDGGLFSQVGYTDKTVTSLAGSPVSVTLSAIPVLPVCDGTPISVTAGVVNGGTSPGYQWWLNGIAAGTGEPQFSFTPDSGDELSCTVTSSATCAISNPATAPPLAQMTIARQLPAICVLPSSNPVPSGVPVTFTVSAAGGGSAPQFNWFVNSVSSGTMASQFTYVPSDFDTVVCTMTSNALCLMGSPVVSSQVIMTVLASSQVQQLENITIDDTRCFGAPQAIMVAGNGTTAAFLAGSEVTLVSGQNIYFLPSTQILAGAWLDAYISTDGILCQQPTRPLVSPAEIAGTSSGKAGPTGVRVYPNPASDRFFIQITGSAAGESAELEVYGSTGALVSRSRLETGKVFDQSVATWSPGLYQLRVTCRGSILTSRLLISRR